MRGQLFEPLRADEFEHLRVVAEVTDLALRVQIDGREAPASAPTRLRRAHPRAAMRARSPPNAGAVPMRSASHASARRIVSIVF